MKTIEKVTKAVTERLHIKPTASFAVTEWLVKIILEEYNKVVDKA